SCSAGWWPCRSMASGEIPDDVCRARRHLRGGLGRGRGRGDGPPRADRPLVADHHCHDRRPAGADRGLRQPDDPGRPVPLRRGLVDGRASVARSCRGPRLAAGRGTSPPEPAGAAHGPEGADAMTTAHSDASTPSSGSVSPSAPVGAAVRQLVGSSRPVSWINTAYPFAAAYLLAGGGITTALVVGTLWFLVPYNLLMYGVNDVFDYESDLRNPRKGGVEGVVLSRRWHRLTLWAAALTNLPFVVALVLLGDVFSTVVLAISVFAVIAYSAPGLRFKERPVLDSVTSSTHFVSPAVFGLAIADAELTTPVLLALAAFFVWGMASQAFGAVQDIIADREGGISSIATVLGA